MYRRLMSKGAGGSYLFSEAGTGKKGIEQCCEHRPDCVLLDFRLPDIDGVQLLDVLAGLGTESPIPVVMLTGQGSEDVAVEAMKRGAQDYLIKDSLTSDALRGAVNNAVDTVARQTEFKRLAIIDGLTALYNRGYLMKRVPEEVERANRYGLDLCLLMADLDHFKAVNDRHGHLAGDEVLKFFGKVLSACTRNTDIAARFGGEEFCIVLTNTELAASQNIAERICEQIRDRQHCGKDGDVFQVTCSIGLASLEPHMKDADTLLEQADAALYIAKHQGRNRIYARAPTKTGIPGNGRCHER